MDSDTEYKQQLIRNSIDAQKTFDRGLLTLSAGEIVLSVTVITELEKILCKELLLAGWVFLLTSLFSQLSSHLLSVKAHDLALDDKRTESEKINKYIDFLNIVSLSLFTFGSIVFLWFIISNV